MLYHLLFPLSDRFGVFNVFQYITFRTALAALFAMILSLLLGPPTIRWLRRLSVGQTVRDVGPETHLEKQGTPTMGGVLIVISVVVPTLLWADLGNTYVWLTLASTTGFALVGFADDYLKVTRKSHQGLRARTKFTFLVLVAV